MDNPTIRLELDLRLLPGANIKIGHTVLDHIGMKELDTFVANVGAREDSW